MLDAVARSKLLYGLESAQLTQAAVLKLDVFQLKGLRKILKLQTTFVDRANSNQYVYDRANQMIQQEGRRYEIHKYSDVYKLRKAALLEKILTNPDMEPLKEATLDTESLTPADFGTRRVGRPRMNWPKETMKEY